MMLVIVCCSVHLALFVLFIEIEKHSVARRMLFSKSANLKTSLYQSMVKQMIFWNCTFRHFQLNSRRLITREDEAIYVYSSL